jgi:amidase
VPDYVGGLRKSLSGVRLGFDERYATTDVLDETKAILDQAIRILSARGVALRAVKMPETRDAIRSWTPVCLAEAVCVHEHVEGARPDGYSQSFVQFLEAGKGVSGKDYARANLARRQFAGNLNAVFADVDLLLVPVTGNAVPTFEEFARICPDPEGLERLIYFTCIYDVSGHPTITLPAGLSSSGEPLGFQLVAPHLGEDLLCRAGFAWQEDFGWDGRPPLD